MSIRSPLAERIPGEGPARLAAGCGLLLLLALLAWAALARVDIVVTVPAVARASAGTVEVRASAAGVVGRIPARDGDPVTRGQVLVALQDELERRRHAVALAAARRWGEELAEHRAALAVLQHDGARPPASSPSTVRRLAGHRRQMARFAEEIGGLRSELAALRARVSAAERSREAAEERFRAVEHALNAGALSRFEWLNARQDYELKRAEAAALAEEADALRRRLEARRFAESAADAEYREDLRRSLVRRTVEMADLEARLADAADALRRTTIRAPVTGIADRVLVKPGSFVERGEAVAVVVPAGSPVHLEARIAPSQMAFLAPGMPCRIKLDALPFARYGALSCEVVNLSRDAVAGEDGGYYLARLAPAAQTLVAAGEPVAVRPGATGWVDIVAGSRTVLSFLTEPLWRFADEAFRER